MVAPIVETEGFWWAVGVAVGFPLGMILLGEMALRLRRAGRPIASTVSQIRNLVLPTLAAYALLNHVVGLPHDHTAAHVVDTIFSLTILHTVLSFIDDVAFAGAEPGSWRARVPRLFLDLARFLIILVGVAIVLNNVWGADLDKLITALGVGSLVLGLALQEPLGNVFAGIVLMFERPFTVGDWINVDGTVGQVIEINWRAVHLLTPTLELLVVPTAKLSKGNVSNYTRLDRRYTATVALGFPSDQAPNKVRALLVETAAATPGVVESPGPFVETAEFTDGKITYKVHFTVADYATLDRTRDDFLTRLWYTSRREGIAVPAGGPTTSAAQDIAGLLSDFPGFGVRDPGTLADVAAAARVEVYGAGEVVVSAGHLARGLHLILDGCASLALPDRDHSLREIARARRGEFFGEASVLSGEPSEVTVTAVEDLHVVVLDSKALQLLLDHTPRLAREIGRVMDARRKSARAARTLRATGS